VAEVKTAVSKPFGITVGGTRLTGITESTYTKDGNVIKGVEEGKSATVNYYVEVDKETYDAVDNENNRTTTSKKVPIEPGSSTTVDEFKYYRRVAELDSEGKFQPTEYTGDDLNKELANYNNGKSTPLTTVTANANNAIADAENIDVTSTTQNQTNLSRNLGDEQAAIDAIVGGELAPIDINVGEAKVRTKYGTYYYPKDLESNKQDRIIFTMKTSEGSIINPNFGEQTIKRKSGGTIEGSVTLPIQPSITDSNSVDWQGSNLNAVGAFAAGASLGVMNSPTIKDLGSNVGKILGSIAKELRKNENKTYSDALKVYLAQEAVGLQGLLSRTSGAILNPNMELLFNAPSLRPFTFTFRLSPRDSTEATQVRNIIRFFKQGMSVKTTETSVFLKAPNVFDIRYMSYDKEGNEIKDHPSLNRIKTCALTACDVNYTPDGTYMTFNDEKRTMTSYEMSLRFTELDPVYDSDYSDSEGNAVSKTSDISGFNPNSNAIGKDEIGF